MKERKLFQTLENRDNADEVEKHGPYICDAKSAWLGTGYYFWDTFESNAHWWGSHRYGKTYFICRAKCDYYSERCFDLHGDTEDMSTFAEYLRILKESGLADEKTTPARVLAHMRLYNKKFNYEAVRAYGINSVSDTKEGSKQYSFRLKFDEKGQYLDYRPAIQFCLFRQNSLNLKDFKVFYPEDYRDGDLD